jgi:hypothetical protein
MKRFLVAFSVTMAAVLLAASAAPAQPRPAAPVRVDQGAVQMVLPPDIGLQGVGIDWANSRIVIGVTRTPGTKAVYTRVFTDISGPWMRSRPLDSPGLGEAVVTTGGPNPFQYTKHGEQDLKFDGRLSYTVYESFSPAINKILKVRVACWDVDNPANPGNNVVELAGGDRPPRPAAVLDYITSAAAAPSGDKLRATIKVTNPRSETLRNLRLILIQGHSAVHEWKPLGLGPQASASVHWDVAVPAPGVTVNFEAILTTDLDAPLPPPDTFLDRQSFSYRRGTTITGTP